MSHSSGGVIHLDDSDADVEEVGSDVEEAVMWWGITSFAGQRRLDGVSYPLRPQV